MAEHSSMSSASPAGPRLRRQNREPTTDDIQLTWSDSMALVLDRLVVARAALCARAPHSALLYLEIWAEREVRTQCQVA